MSLTSTIRSLPWQLRGVALSALAAAALVACGGGSNDTSVPAANTTASLKLNLTGLENLGSSAVYEGWLVTATRPVSSGRFSVDASGKLSQTEFSVPRTQADAATAFVLTIEPATNDPAAPADTHLLAGSVSLTRRTTGCPGQLGQLCAIDCCAQAMLAC